VQPSTSFATFVAPAAWHAIDFISDLHLTTSTPRTFEAFADYLRRTPADAVWILGDLFEVWVGDDTRLEGFEARVTAALAEASSHHWIGFMAGNRDFLLGDAMLRDCGMHAVADPTLLCAFGKRTLLVHGDALCLGDESYQAFRRVVRDPKVQAEFLSRALPERRSIAQTMREESERGKGTPPPGATADLDRRATVALMEAAGAATLIHGHTHRPRSAALAPGRMRHVLSDWDLDDPAAARAEVLRWQASGFARLPWHDAVRPAR